MSYLNNHLRIREMDFTIYTVETAPEDSKSALITAKEVFGFIPNLEGFVLKHLRY